MINQKMCKCWHWGIFKVKGHKYNLVPWIVKKHMYTNVGKYTKGAKLQIFKMNIAFCETGGA